MFKPSKRDRRSKFNIWQACRLGNVDKVRECIEIHKVNVNRRDECQETPLSYAVFKDAREVVKLLLAAGALCNLNVLDGNRVHHAASLGPLAIYQMIKDHAHLRPPEDLCGLAFAELVSHIEHEEQLGPQEALWPDVVFKVRGRSFACHAGLLSVRSAYLKEVLTQHAAAHPVRDDEEAWVIDLGHTFTLAAFKALLVYLYCQRMDVPLELCHDVLAAARTAGCTGLATIVESEIKAVCTFFGTIERLKSKEETPNRFILHPDFLPLEERLQVHMRALFNLTQQLSSAGEEGPGPDFADAVLKVGLDSFRCHRAILAVRSEFFRGLLKTNADGFFRTPDHVDEEEEEVLESAFAQSAAVTSALPHVLLCADVTAPNLAVVLSMVLRYCYTNTLQEDGDGDGNGNGDGDEDSPLTDVDTVEGLLFLADYLLMPDLLDAVDTGTMEQLFRPAREVPLEAVCRILLFTDYYAAEGQLREECVDRIARSLDVISTSGTPQQREVLMYFARSIMSPAATSAQLAELDSLTSSLERLGSGLVRWGSAAPGRGMSRLMSMGSDTKLPSALSAALGSGTFSGTFPSMGSGPGGIGDMGRMSSVALDKLSTGGIVKDLRDRYCAVIDPQGKDNEQARMAFDKKMRGIARM